MLDQSNEKPAIELDDYDPCPGCFGGLRIPCQMCGDGGKVPRRGFRWPTRVEASDMDPVLRYLLRIPT